MCAISFSTRGAGPAGLALAILTCAVLAGPVRGDDIYVDTCGLDTALGTTPNCADPIIVFRPKRTIQSAIELAANGDTVHVAPGTYNEAIDFLGKAITLTSEDPTDPDVVAATEISAVGLSSRVVRCDTSEGPQTELKGFTIKGGIRNGYGGGMYIGPSCSPTVRHCRFTSNVANRGGGMYVSSGSPEIEHCTFKANAAVISDGLGGGMYVDSGSPTLSFCTFESNAAESHGAGLYIASGSPVIQHGTFDGSDIDDALVNRGGGLYIDSGSPVVFMCDFSSHTTSSEFGAAVHNESGSPVIEGCTFDQNLGQNGGGMYSVSGNPHITGCDWTGNTALNFGGALVFMAGEPTVADCEFTGNEAAMWGGGILSQSDELTVDNCTFRENVAGSWGGGVNIYSGIGVVTNCRFEDNEAERGGGLSGLATVDSCVFTGNTATVDGGGMMGGVTVSNCQFEGNTAMADGGGMAAYTNPSPIVTACTFRNNSAVNGGGMHSLYGDPRNCTFYGNTASHDGGGLNGDYLETVANCVFSGNEAGWNGGGLNAIRPTVTNCSFSGNEAAGLGGGARFDATPTGGGATVANSIFWQNTPTEISSSHATVYHSNVRGGWSPGINVTTSDPTLIRLPDRGPDGSWGTADDDYGDLALSASSHCIDAGSNPDVADDVSDLDGDGDVTEPCPRDVSDHGRFRDDPGMPDVGVPDGVNPIVDFGAYEFRGNSDLTCADTDGNGSVNVDDMVHVILDFGTDGFANGGDVDGSGLVDIDDVILVILTWGPCL